MGRSRDVTPSIKASLKPRELSVSHGWVTSEREETSGAEPVYNYADLSFDREHRKFPKENDLRWRSSTYVNANCLVSVCPVGLSLECLIFLNPR